MKIETDMRRQCGCRAGSVFLAGVIGIFAMTPARADVVTTGSADPTYNTFGIGCIVDDGAGGPQAGPAIVGNVFGDSRPGTLRIDLGCTFEIEELAIDNGVVIISGPGTTWIMPNNSRVGISLPGTLLIDDGAVVTNQGSGFSSTIGQNAGSSGTVTVQNGGQWFLENQDLTVGQGSFNCLDVPLPPDLANCIDSEGIFGGATTGSLNISEGGVVTSKNLTVGSEPSTSGMVNVSGAGSEMALDGGSFNVGRIGTGGIDVSNGAAVTALFGTIGRLTDGVGTVNVTGPGSVLNMLGNGGTFGAFLTVGKEQSSFGALNVLDGAQVVFDSLDPAITNAGMQLAAIPRASGSPP